MKKYKYGTVAAIGHRRTPNFFSINVGSVRWVLCLWLKKFGCVRVGFVWGRQWLTLC